MCFILPILIAVRTYQRWTEEGEVKADGRPSAQRPEPGNKLTQAERDNILEVANSQAFKSLPPTASFTRPDTRRQSYLDAVRQIACKRGGVHTRSYFRKTRVFILWVGESGMTFTSSPNANVRNGFPVEVAVRRSATKSSSMNLFGISYPSHSEKKTPSGVRFSMALSPSPAD